MLNKVFLIGRLTKDPEIRILPSGNKVAELSIAFNRNYKDKTTNEWKNEPHYFDVKVWGSTIDRLDKIQKGTSVLIEGRLSQERWTNQDGKTVSKVLIVAEFLRIVSQPNTNGENTTMKSQSEDTDIELDKLKNINEETDDNFTNDDDDVPF